MANFFDKFDDAATASGNPFDQFDEPTKPTEGGFAPREAREREISRDERRSAYREMARGVRERQSTFGRYADTAVRGAARAVPFMDELASGVLNPFKSTEDYQEELDRQRAMSQVDDEDRMFTSIGGQLAGSLALPGAGWASTGGALSRVAKGAALGTGYGALYGAGSGDTMGERAQGAYEGAKMGLGFGLVGGAGLEAARAGAGALNALARPLIGYARPDDEALRRVGAALGQDRAVGAGRLMDDAAYDLAERAGQEPMLIDRGGGTLRALARDAKNSSPEAAQILESALAERAATQNEAAGNFLSRLFSPLRSPNPEATIERLKRRAQAANSANYARAEQAAENLVSPRGQINPAFPDGLMTPVLDRLAQSPLVQDAMKRSVSTGANEAAMRGYRNMPPRNPFVETAQGYILRPAGPNGDRVLPTLSFWDQVQRNLRSIYQEAQRSGNDTLARQASVLRQQLNSHLDEIIPEFGQARAGAARFFGAEDAMEAGQNFFNMTKRQDLAKAREAIGKMSPPERALFAEGYLAAAEHAARSAGDGRTASRLRLWNSPAEREKLQIAVGPRRAAEADAYRARAQIMEWMNSTVRGGSHTAQQIAMAGLAGGAAGSLMTGDLQGGIGGASAMMLARYGAKGIKGAVDQKVAGEVARILSSNDPAVYAEVLRRSQRPQAVAEALNRIEAHLAKSMGVVGDEVADRKREPIEITVTPRGYAEGGPVLSPEEEVMSGIGNPGPEVQGPPRAPESIPELDPFASEKAIGRGLTEIPGTVGRYVRDTPLRQMPRDVGKVAGAMWEGIKEDPLGAALDMTPVIGQIRSAQDAEELAAKAKEAEAAGDTEGASVFRQLAALAAAGMVPGMRGAGKAAKAAGKGAKVAIPSMTLPEDIVAASHPGRISTRLPTAVKKVDDPVAGHLTIGLNEMKADPDLFEANANLLRDYPNLPEQIALKGTPDEVAEAMVEHAKDNLLWLYNRVPEEVRQRSQQWYDGARAITDRWTQKYGVPDTSVAGVLAALSPQKDWFQNVSLGERVLDIVKTKGNHIWDDPMEVKAAEIFGGEKYKPLVDLVRGKSFSELKTPDERALWLRLYDEAYNDRGHRLVTPEGEFGDYVVDANNLASGTGWGSLNEIGKAIQAALSDGSRESLSGLMGERHKVRNFYNNILDPNGPHGDVTMDTHAVAAALLRPLSGNSLEVAQNFANSLDKKFQQKIADSGRTYAAAKGSSVTGVQGLYPLYAEAYRRAAAEAGILPRQMQSVTWEAVRGLFKDTFKSDQRNVASIDEIWYKYRRGELTLDEARDQIEAAAGGITHPDWWGRDAVAHAQSPDSSYAGELPASRVLRSNSAAVDDRARAGAAQGAAGSEGLVWRERPVEGGDPRGVPGNPEAVRDVGRGNSGPDGRHVRVLEDPSGRFPAFGELAPANAGVFHEALAKAKATGHARMASVSLYEPGDYANMRTFLTEDGTAGFAIKPDGDIVSVFNTPGGPNKGLADGMLPLAIQMGGRKLDAFDTALPDIYSKHGFRAVARTRFNDEFAPPGWDRGGMKRYNNGRPDIVFMVWDPKHKERYNPGDGRVYASYEDAAAAQAVEADRIWAQEQRAKRKPKKQLARGGSVDSSPDELHQYLLATSNLAPPQRYAMGGAVFPAAVEPRMNALNRGRRGALSTPRP